MIGDAIVLAAAAFAVWSLASALTDLLDALYRLVVRLCKGDDDHHDGHGSY